MKTNVNTDPRDYVAEAPNSLGRPRRRDFCTDSSRFVECDFDPSTINSQHSTVSAEGNYANSSDTLFRSIGAYLAPDDPPPSATKKD